MRKRFYILFVARDAEGQLRKIPIPIHYLYVFMVGALIGMFTITGMAGSYTRMLMKVTRFNQLRSEKEALKSQYSQLEQSNQEKEIQVASLGSVANEVSVLYGLKPDGKLIATTKDADSPVKFTESLNRLYALRDSAMTGVATAGIGNSYSHAVSLTDWVRAADAPQYWPVTGPITGPFGERSDPFNGEGAFHPGIDISSTFGQPVLAPADGDVTFADFYSGYGRMISLDHGHGIVTRYGHLSGFTVIEGQHVQRGQVIGYVGMSGRTTGPHLHYEVRINDTPVNPKKYLRKLSPRDDVFGGS
ncbi:peptidase M23B [Candidatus Koribacter versatilis Ellin345]|uniref:Peptidase M23B n=1 Tax=Koribacter versatilis (strain Ellin345) TaxID=204669 RepID=Q1IHF8_KORVE|nr:M23 family metallopeptidase [Candidatus Koribacter versatilis]ABF43692.1 peptidase M23B [Candidatus Koribacter versatilis Ellin345]